jgi:hypothetical protein
MIPLVPLDVIDIVVSFVPLTCLLANRRCHRRAKAVELTLPYSYRTGLCGFKCKGGGRGLVLIDCQLTGHFVECHLTKCTLRNMHLNRCIYIDCVFHNCVVHGTGVSLVGGVMRNCRLMYNHIALINNGKLVVDGCTFSNNSLGIYTGKGAETTIMNCVSTDRQFGVSAGSTKVLNNTCSSSAPFYMHRGSVHAIL